MQSETVLTPLPRDWAISSFKQSKQESINYSEAKYWENYGLWLMTSFKAAEVKLRSPGCGRGVLQLRGF